MDQSDPREGEFAQLILIRQLGAAPDGPWSFRHWGSGQCGFTNAHGDFIPATAVAEALRART